MGNMIAHRLDEPQCAYRDDVGDVFGHLERHFDMALRAQIVQLVRAKRLEDLPQRAACEVAVIQDQLRAGEVPIAAHMIYAIRIEQAGTLDKRVNPKMLIDQELCQIGAFLTGNADD